MLGLGTQCCNRIAVTWPGLYKAHVNPAQIQHWGQWGKLGGSSLFLLDSSHLKETSGYSTRFYSSFSYMKDDQSLYFLFIF